MSILGCVVYALFNGCRISSRYNNEVYFCILWFFILGYFIIHSTSLIYTRGNSKGNSKRTSGTELKTFTSYYDSSAPLFLFFLFSNFSDDSVPTKPMSCSSEPPPSPPPSSQPCYFNTDGTLCSHSNSRTTALSGVSDDDDEIISKRKRHTEDEDTVSLLSKDKETDDPDEWFEEQAAAAEKKAQKERRESFIQMPVSKFRFVTTLENCDNTLETCLKRGKIIKNKSLNVHECITVSSSCRGSGSHPQVDVYNNNSFPILSFSLDEAVVLISVHSYREAY